MINLNVITKFIKSFNKTKRSLILNINPNTGTATNSIRPLTAE